MDQHTIATSLAWEGPSRQLRLQSQEAVAAKDRVVDDRVLTFEVAAEGLIPSSSGHAVRCA